MQAKQAWMKIDLCFTFEILTEKPMKNLRIALGFVAILFIASACHRVKCPTDTFSKADIEQQNQVEESAQ